MRLMRPSVPSNVAIDGPVDESLPTYSGGSTYALGDRVLYTDMTLFVNVIYESAQASNTGHALTDPDWWIFVSYSNVYRMFDQVSNSQTTAADSIRTAFFATPLANMVSLLNIDGASVTVNVYTGVPVGVISDPVGGTLVYTETQSLLIAGDGVGDWYEYFFGDVGRRHDALFVGLPSYADQVIEVILEETGATVAIGTLSVGYGYNIGDTQYGAGIGITDFSIKQADAFGFYQIVERTFSKKGDFTVRIPKERGSEITTLLTQYRSQPAIFIGADDYPESYIYGFIKDWRLTLQFVSHSIYTLEIEGLA